MFGIFADLLSSALTILLPVFASYKALRSSDPSQLAPWLMYWVVLSVVLLAESWTVFILGWIPFYSWFRLFFFAYLVLPQTQGARIFYQDYVDPFLARHEREIEDYIGQLHDRAKGLGLQYFYQAVEFAQEKFLGRKPEPAPAPPTKAAGYAQSLLSRFNLPTAAGTESKQGAQGAPAGDWLSTIGSAVAAATSSGKNHDARAEELSASGSLFPREMGSMSRAEKAQFINNQQDLLDVLHKALAKERTNLGDDDTAERSENSFDRIEHEDVAGGASRRTASGGWASGWFGGDETARQR